MISIEEAKKYCAKAKCGYCLTHEIPLTCCNPMLNIFMKENGLDWCKKNIREYELQKYEAMKEEEINKIFNIKPSKKDLEELSLFDFLEL